MPPNPPAPARRSAPRRPILPPVLLAGAAVLLAIAAAVDAARLLAERRAVVREAAAVGLDEPSLLRTVRREADSHRGRLVLAEAALERALGPEAGDDEATATDDALRRLRLETARDLARTVLADRPGSWQAASLAGAATYLLWSEARDPRLVRDHRTWEEPLRYARRIAPERPQPGRYLAAAYVELWPVLSETKRAAAREMLADAFRDRRTFGRIIEPWLRIASGPAALEPIPDASWAWSRLERIYAERRAWPTACMLRDRAREALAVELRATLAEADRLLAGGELSRARSTLLGVVAAAPAELRFAPVVEHALRWIPHGPGRGRRFEPAARWLEWSMSRDLLEASSLPGATLSRLRALAFSGRPGEPADAALAAWVDLARGRWNRDARFEPRSEELWRPAWGPYLILEARRLADAGRPGEARTALEAVHPSWQSHPAFERVRAAVAGASSGVPSDASSGVPSEVGPPAASGGSGVIADSVLGWTRRGDTARLDFSTRHPAAGATVALGDTPANGAMVDLALDGERLGCRPVRPGARLEIERPISPGLHRIEVESLASGRVWPGRAELTPPRRRAPPG